MPRLREPFLLQEDHLLTFALEGLFPATHRFILNRALGTLLHLAQEPGNPHPTYVGEQQFTERELSLVLPLLANYPAYAPMEELYASFFGGYRFLTEQAIARARTRLGEVLEDGAWDHELRPIRNVMSRVRYKLRPLGLSTVSLIETGYLLIGHPGSRSHE